MVSEPKSGPGKKKTKEHSSTRISARSNQKQHDVRMLRNQAPTYERLLVEQLCGEVTQSTQENVSIHCGWGRLHLAHTFASPGDLAKRLLEEARGERDVAFYVSDPHVALSLAPQQLFLDPSDTYRLWMSQYRPNSFTVPGATVRRASSSRDVTAINDIYKQRKMVPIPEPHLQHSRHSKCLIYLVTEDLNTGAIIGTVMGVNHVRAFDDPYKGSSLWSLAVANECKTPGVGEAMVRYLAEHFQARGCDYMDLSVLHDNSEAKALYEKLGFQRIKTFALKKKNAINEKLFVGPEVTLNLNPYAQIIVDEALRRGIEVTIDDEENNLFTLGYGGRQIRCHESLTDLTTGYAMTLCQNKLLTHRVCSKVGLHTPCHQRFVNDDDAREFLQEHGTIVVKPMDSEQGKGISVDIRSSDELSKAISLAKAVSDQILLESYHPGLDLRVVVIGYKTVAAAIRHPAEVRGNGRNDLRTLINKQSRRREAATSGESSIPVDAETERCIEKAGYTFDSILQEGQHLFVRKTANLHTGGTLTDVTSELHPQLRRAAEQAAKALQIPVVGMDFIVPNAHQPDYVIIEANERPGLENHAPQPTAQRFIDLLFPLSQEAGRP